jgi:hypothetical protein
VALGVGALVGFDVEGYKFIFLDKDKGDFGGWV